MATTNDMLANKADTDNMAQWKARDDEHHGWDKDSKDNACQEVLHKELEAI
jgi:hypothetical protein